MTLRYIGSKARVARAIVDLLGPPTSSSVFVDAFCGTGAVAQEAAVRGWPIRINDHLRAAVCVAEATIAPVTASEFKKLGGYETTVRQLNQLSPRMGFIRRHYSPDSRASMGHERRYLTAENAGRVDAIRNQIAEWAAAGELTAREERLLLADLLEGTSQVANTAGTYGSYLREWSAPALRPLLLAPRPVSMTSLRLDVLNGDVWDVPFAPGDVAYFDPPYTKRQYAAYYHLLETIAVGDEPTISGVTGLRPWRHLASDFCYKTRAMRAMSSLIEATTARRILLSYSSEGHVRLDRLMETLAQSGSVALHEVGSVGRYRPNEAASSAGSAVTEFVIEIRKPTAAERLPEPLIAARD